MALGDNARRGLAGPRRLAVDAAGYPVGPALAGIAAVRRGKPVHPRGAVYEAELVVPSHGDALGGTELFGRPGRRRALVRFSRSLGLPRPLPDLLGMSLRVPDAAGAGRDQDFLMVTSVDAPPETDALRFNPWNAGGGLEPTGLLNRLRDYAYPLSQRAWARARRANDQAEAETAVERQFRG